MARISYPNPEELDPKIKEFYDNIPMKLNMALMACHAPSLVKQFLSLGSAILLNSKTPAVLRELMILRVGAVTDAKYELEHHITIAKRTGVDESLIKYALSPKITLDNSHSESDLNQEALLIFNLADEILSNGAASKETVDRLTSHFGQEITVELILICGFYSMVSQYLKTLDIDLDT